MRETPEKIRKPRRDKTVEMQADHSEETAPPAPKKRGRPKNVVETPVEVTAAEERHEEEAEMSEAEHG